MVRKLPAFVLFGLLCALAPYASQARQVYVSKEGNVYKVVDPVANTTVYVSNIEAYLKHKYARQKVDGFGKQISNKEFVKGATPVEDTVEAAANTANYAAGATYNVANRVPSWRKYTAPLKAIFGSSSKPAQQQQSF